MSEEPEAPKLVRKVMVNTDVYTHIWFDLQRIDDRTDKDGKVIANAGTTLELDPQEEAAVMVLPDFVDPWLKEAKVGAPKRTGQTKETNKDS